MRQDASASGNAQQALQASGIQNNYFGHATARDESAVSIAPPFGERDDSLPLRGRDELLAELAGTQSRMHVLHGLGGCGKTRLALETAYQADERGTEVWWVSATESSSLVTGMRALGRRLGVSGEELDHGDAADVIWQRLGTRHDPWLLVIDGADDPQILAGAGRRVAEGRGWLRPLPLGEGMVLVTSCDGAEASWGTWCRRHRLAVLPDDEAARVLADYAGRRADLGSDEEARELAERLGGLPLALKIVGSYLAESAAVPAAFADKALIRTYRQYRDSLATGDLNGVFPDHTSEVIGRTWDLTLDVLDARGIPESRRLLRLLATFADAPIPYEQLLHPNTLAESSLFTDITGSRLWQALQALDAFGLIDLSSSDKTDIPTARLHPLVRDASAPQVANRELADCLDLAAKLLKYATDQQPGTPEDPTTWPARQLLAPHAIYAFDSVMSEPGRSDDAALAAADIAGSAARYQATQGLHARAEATLRRAWAIQQVALGSDHPDTLTSRHSMAVEMAELGDYANAETQLREVLTGRLRILGPDHESTLDTRHEIAWVMAEQGDFVGAQDEYRDVLAARLRVQGPEHLHTLAARHEVARVMTQLGNYAGAEAESRDVLATRLRVLGPDHPDTLITRHQIAWLMAAREDFAGAEAEYRIVLAAKVRVRGPDHPSTLATRHEIARVMTERGDYTDAEAEFREVLAAKVRVLGPDHPSTRATARWINDFDR
jgi:hypothetical protein